ncbi:hypothetical protein EVAR_6940_1 [Eumeta japonica]|uniref:Uncharacterized protein n=1 Tax=Eumeta variegata TaxID=151549 RepID=A0A4C1TJ28_EUMVA|nr:hypothetical protein EVAR_6940_1 [Eumeta japonica]
MADSNGQGHCGNDPPLRVGYRSSTDIKVKPILTWLQLLLLHSRARGSGCARDEALKATPTVYLNIQKANAGRSRRRRRQQPRCRLEFIKLYLKVQLNIKFPKPFRRVLTVTVGIASRRAHSNNTINMIPTRFVTVKKWTPLTHCPKLQNPAPLHRHRRGRPRARAPTASRDRCEAPRRPLIPSTKLTHLTFSLANTDCGRAESRDIPFRRDTKGDASFAHRLSARRRTKAKYTAHSSAQRPECAAPSKRGCSNCHKIIRCPHISCETTRVNVTVKIYSQIKRSDLVLKIRVGAHRTRDSGRGPATAGGAFENSISLVRNAIAVPRCACGRTPTNI